MSRSSCSGQNIWDFNQADTTEQGASLISEAPWKSVWVCVCGGGMLFSKKCDVSPIAKVENFYIFTKTPHLQ